MSTCVSSRKIVVATPRARFWGPALGDDDRLPGVCSFEKPREVRLGLVDVHLARRGPDSVQSME
jgi:hypothetical protein